MKKNQRSKFQKIKDFITFPVRSLLVTEHNKWGLTSLRNERYDYAAKEVKGYCLDVGCCRNNAFINNFLSGNGVGIDNFPFEGLTSAHLVEDFTKFPFKEKTFDSVTFLANINHIPEKDRDLELSEAYRCLKTGGTIIIQTAIPWVSIVAHVTAEYYDKIFKTNHHTDTEMGMDEDDYYVKESEVFERLKKAGFVDIKKKSFGTQWWLNRLYVGWKK